MNSFSVSPTRFELFVPPGGEKTFSISLANNTGRTATFQLAVLDLAVGKSPDADLTLSNGVGPYSLREYIRAGSPYVTVNNAQSATIPFVVSIPETLKSPGLYGAVTVTLVSSPAPAAGTGARVQSRLGVGVLVRTVEHPRLEAHLVQFDTLNGARVFWSGPLTFKIAYANDGNVHVEPAGRLSLTDLFGRTTTKANLLPMVILPAAIRSQTINLAWPNLPGYFSAHLVIEDGLGGHHQERAIGLLVLPWQYLLIILAAATVILVAVVKNSKFKSQNVS